MTTIETQKQMIADWLNLGLKLTPLDAWKKFGCSKASSRIGELENEGRIPKVKRERVKVFSKVLKRDVYVMSYQI